VSFTFISLFKYVVDHDILKNYCRAGAENLYKATENKKLKEKINLELSFMNSTLQLLKEQLAELNSAVDVYQHEK
jgi:hypothetical protein